MEEVPIFDCDEEEKVPILEDVPPIDFGITERLFVVSNLSKSIFYCSLRPLSVL